MSHLYDDAFCNETGDIPAHIIVQRQLQDVIISQQKSMENLRERLASEEGMVSKQQYEAIVKDLQDERISHASTKRKLMDTQDKLDFTQGEVKILERQLDQEKDQFVKTSGMLKNKALQVTKKNVELENKCHEMCLDKEDKIDIVENQTTRIESLSTRLTESQTHHERHLLECELQKQQQMYINQVMQEKDKKSIKSGTIHQRDAINPTKL